jgi:MoxR-like ATPase
MLAREVERWLSGQEDFSEEHSRRACISQVTGSGLPLERLDRRHDEQRTHPVEPTSPSESPRQHAAVLEDALFQVKRVIVGQDRMVERALVCLLARGHCLLEGVPGLAKTLTVSTLAQVVGGTFARIQFTPDLVPADIVGTRVWRPSREEFDIEWGPVFANIVLADEINPAPAKVQSALLEVMAERQVSIGGQTRPLPVPFLTMATENPIESEGVYALPEAQRDRFLMQVVVNQPSYNEETEIARRMGVNPPQPEQVLSLDQLIALQSFVDEIFVHHAVADYAVRLVMTTREPNEWGLPDIAPHVALGASPRATLGLIAAARALAVLRGRRFAVPQDIFDVAPEILRHRLILSYDAIAEGVTTDMVINQLLATVPAPHVTPKQDDVQPTAMPPVQQSQPQPDLADPFQPDPATQPAPTTQPIPPAQETA